MNLRLLIAFCYPPLLIAVTERAVEINWYYYPSIIGASLVCFAVTYFQDYKNANRPSFLYRFFCSMAASYLAYFLHPSIRGFHIDVFEVVNFKPFESIQLFVGMCSFFGIAIFKELSELKTLRYNIGEYLSKLGDRLKAKRS